MDKLAGAIVVATLIYVGGDLVKVAIYQVADFIRQKQWLEIEAKKSKKK